jgi:hypothetical protein
MTRREMRAARMKLFRNIVLGMLAFIGFVLYWGFKPITGNMYYGICRVFLESKFVYPKSLHISEVDFYKEEQRIYYTAIEPFGSTLSGDIKCQYAKPTAQTPYVLKSITLNTGTTLNVQPIAEKEIEAFNKTIPIILANPPNLIIPFAATGKCTQRKRDKKAGKQTACAISAQELQGLKVGK